MWLIMDSPILVPLGLKEEMLHTHDMYKIQIQGFFFFFLTSQLLSAKIIREQKIDS